MHSQYNGRFVAVPIRERFWPKVNRTDFCPCWRWQGDVRGNMGYGVITTGLQKIPAHHYAWQDAGGAPIQDGFKVCHTCDIPTCVRNDEEGFYEINGVIRPRLGHLWLGTHDDNMADMRAKGRSTAGDRNGSRLHPERMPRGDRHRSRTSPQTLLRGEAVHCAKLTETDVREIRIRRAAEEPYKTIAEDKGVTTALCCAIALRRIWKHVE